MTIRNLVVALSATAMVSTAGGASSAAAAESASAAEVRAALIYNFARFTDWPPQVLASGGQLSLCVIDDDAVAGALEELVAGRTVRGRGIVVRRVRQARELRACAVAYAGRLDQQRATELVAELKGSSVLTISDYRDFAQLGGVASVFPDKGKMRFAINIDSAQRAQLQMSSQLLTLASVVRGSDVAR